MITAEEIIKKLKLKPHPREGGFFAETYRSAEKIGRSINPSAGLSDKSLATAIHYLLTPDTFSALHRLPTDELFHFYLGDPVTMLLLFPDGKSETVTLGQDLSAGQKVQFLVPRLVWQGAFLNAGGRFALLGTTMSPGFDYEDYEAGDRSMLLHVYPDQKEIIERLLPIEH